MNYYQFYMHKINYFSFIYLFFFLIIFFMYLFYHLSYVIYKFLNLYLIKILLSNKYKLHNGLFQFLAELTKIAENLLN